jgi:hypothetical protein
MKILLALLMFATTSFGQARTAPAQGPPPRNLVQQPDGHFTANSEPANPEKFEIRVVKAGDTLSAIAGEVLKNPRLWPQLWEQNEHIVNPHWIYPNDKILIRPVTLITEATPPPPEPQPEPVQEPPPAPPIVRVGPPRPQEPPPAPQSNIQIAEARPVPEVKDDDLYCSGFIRRAPVSHDLKVLAKFQENLSVFAVHSDYIYLSRGSANGVANGNIYQVIRPTRSITNPEGRTKNERDLGKHYMEVAQVTVMLTQPNYSIARVVRSCAEPVEVGDIMLPFQRITLPALPSKRPFSPFMTATGDVKGTVVITQSALLNYGSVMKLSGHIPGVTGSHLESSSRGLGTEGLIVYVDFGTSQGARPGDLFIIYKDVELNSDLYHLPSDVERIQGARTAVGELVILKVEERASTALVTYATEPISLGDSVERR